MIRLYRGQLQKADGVLWVIPGEGTGRAGSPAEQRRGAARRKKGALSDRLGILAET